MNPRLFVSLLSIVVIVPLLVYWSFTHRGTQIFGIIALAFPVFLVLAWYRAASGDCDNLRCRASRCG